MVISSFQYDGLSLLSVACPVCDSKDFCHFSFTEPIELPFFNLLLKITPIPLLFV